MDFTSLRNSGAKNLMEMLAHDIARATSRSDIARSITSTIQRSTGSTTITRGILSGGGVLLATLLNVKNIPKFITDAFSSVGVDGGTANEIVNEALDSVLRGTTEEMKDNLSEEELSRRLRAGLTELTGPGGKLHGKFKKLTTTPADEAKTTEIFAKKTGTGDAVVYEIHDVACPECQPRTQPGKKGPVTKMGDGITRHTLGWALAQGYQPTQQTCCTKAVAKLVKAARSRKVTLTEMLQSLPAEFHAARQRFFTAMTSAPPEQTALLNELEAIRAWEAEDGKATIGALLLQHDRPPDGFDRVGFIRRIRAIAKPEKPSGESHAASAVTDFFSGVHRALGGAATEIEKAEKTFAERSSALNRIGRVIP